MAKYPVSIEKVRDDKVSIIIRVGPFKFKEFDIIVTDKGLKIISDLDMVVSPQSRNSIIVDEAS